LRIEAPPALQEAAGGAVFEKAVFIRKLDNQWEYGVKDLGAAL
jgi:hypothetical protein